MARLWLAAALVALLPAAVARAHPGNVALADIDITGPRVEVALSVNLFELDLLEVVRLPGRLVEATIALSIVYVALEHLVGRGHDRRVLASFVFGLVHGFGFASVLTELGLPAVGLVTFLLGFNLGVELGQVVIVPAVVPLFALIARMRVRALATRSMAGGLLVLGLVWLVERVR